MAIGYSANMHVTSDLSKLNAPNQYHGSNGITVGKGESLNISHTGTGTIKTPTAIFHLGNLIHLFNLFILTYGVLLLFLLVFAIIFVLWMILQNTLGCTH